jgi:hypothetical protein
VKGRPTARQIDDQAIIVVEDSRTGEVRACGDLTGYCVGMNPWTLPLSAARHAPVAMSEHQQLPGNAAAAAAAKPQASADQTAADSNK